MNRSSQTVYIVGADYIGDRLAKCLFLLRGDRSVSLKEGSRQYIVDLLNTCSHVATLTAENSDTVITGDATNISSAWIGVTIKQCSGDSADST